MTRATDAAAPKLPSWVGEDLVACADGPLAYEWFTRADWDARVETCRYMLDKGHHGSAIDYVEGGQRIPHPTYRGVTATRLTYQPRRNT